MTDRPQGGDGALQGWEIVTSLHIHHIWTVCDVLTLVHRCETIDGGMCCDY